MKLFLVSVLLGLPSFAVVKAPMPILGPHTSPSAVVVQVNGICKKSIAKMNEKSAAALQAAKVKAGCK